MKRIKSGDGVTDAGTVSDQFRSGGQTFDSPPGPRLAKDVPDPEEAEVLADPEVLAETVRPPRSWEDEKQLAQVRAQAEARLGFTAEHYAAYGRAEMLKVKEFLTEPGVYEIVVRKSPRCDPEHFRYDPHGGSINLPTLWEWERW